MPLRRQKDDPKQEVSSETEVAAPESAPTSTPAIVPSDDTKAPPSSAAATATAPTGGWHPLRSARKAAKAVQQKRLEVIQSIQAHNNAAATATASTTHGGNKANDANPADNTAPTTPASAPLQALGQSQPQPQTQDPSQYIPAYSDSFSFSPMPDFIPISSCDIDPPDFDAPTDLKVSQNFSKLITNAKKVDKIRAQAKRGSIDTSTTVQDIMKRDESMTLEEAQRRLIEQLKQGMHFLTSENKELQEQRRELEFSLAEEREMVLLTKNEVKERNLKLAVLEHHFMTINDHAAGNDGDGDGGCEGDEDNDGTGTGDGDGDGDDKRNEVESSQAEKEKVEGDDTAAAEFDSSQHAPVSARPKPVPSTVSSSIIQIDKGYFRELEATVKEERTEKEKMIKVNEDLAMKYAKLEKDSKDELEAMKKDAEDNAVRLESQLNRQNRTIESLEQSLSKSRTLLFKKDKKAKKAHRRRATVNAIPNPDDIARSSNTDEDENSISVTTNDQETETESQSEQDILKKTFVREAIDDAVNTAKEDLEKEHTSLRDMLSKQLELKDNHINSLESKIYGLLKQKNDIMSPQKPMRRDVAIRNVAVTNEVIDTSMRKLENMLSKIQENEEQKSRREADSEDPMESIRRVANKISLVHEEMKVSMKLFEQQIQNAEASQDQPDQNGQGDKDFKESEQTSGEDGEKSAPSEQPSLAELIERATATLKETESSIREEIGTLKDHLASIEYDMAANIDTIEALELACAEHVESYRDLQREYEDLKAGTGGDD